MVIFDKIIKKSAKSEHKLDEIKQGKVAETAKKAEPTIAELKMKEAAAPAKSAEGVKKTAVKNQDTKNAYRILVKPLITEKGTHLVGQNKYLFEVAGRANKIEIKKAIKAVYGVSPIDVNIINVSGKKVSYRRISGRTSDRKKAIVTLPKGQSIEIYEGV